MKIRPLADKVLIERAREQETSRGGIIIPSTAQQKQSEGLVLRVGPGKTLPSGQLMPPQVKEGDRVLFEKYVDRDIEVDGKKFVLISEENISCVLEN